MIGKQTKMPISLIVMSLIIFYQRSIYFLTSKKR